MAAGEDGGRGLGQIDFAQFEAEGGIAEVAIEHGAHGEWKIDGADGLFAGGANPPPADELHFVLVGEFLRVPAGGRVWMNMLRWEIELIHSAEYWPPQDWLLKILNR